MMKILLYQQSNNTIINLNTEIEARQSDSRLLLTAYQQTEQNIRNAESLVHYLEFDLDNHILYIVIPVEVSETEEGEFSHGDALPSETLTMNEIEDGVYDPSTKIEEIEEKKYTNYVNTQFDKDGLTVYGTINSINVNAEQLQSKSILSEQLQSTSILSEEVASTSILSEQLQSTSILSEQIQSSVIISEDTFLTNSVIFPTCYLENINKSDGTPIETIHPLAGQTVQVPNDIPSAIDDNYIYYLFLGGVIGDTVLNPNIKAKHYYIENDEQKYYTERITSETVIIHNPKWEDEEKVVRTIHFDIGNRLDVIPSQLEYIELDETFTFDENLVLQGVLFYPAHQIYGISEDWESPSSYTIPTSLSVSKLISAGLEVASDDIKNALDIIQSNAQQIENIHNSTGGYDKTSEESYNWKLWTYIKKWIMKAFEDWMNDENDTAKWGENFPSRPSWWKLIEDMYDRNLSVSGKTLTFGEPWTVLGGSSDCCNLDVNGTVSGGILCQQCGIKTDWLFIDDNNNFYAYNFNNQIKRECNLRCCGKAIFESKLYIPKWEIWKTSGDKIIEWFEGWFVDDAEEYHEGYRVSDEEKYEIHNVFAAKEHNHDERYSLLNHSHNYAASNHNHDERYSLLNHTHQNYLQMEVSQDETVQIYDNTNSVQIYSASKIDEILSTLRTIQESISSLEARITLLEHPPSDPQILDDSQP